LLRQLDRRSGLRPTFEADIQDTPPATIRDYSVSEEETLLFIQSKLSSVWALELLLLLSRSAPRNWSRPELIHELRGSESVVSAAIQSLHKIGLVVEDQPDRFIYRPANGFLGDIVASIDQIYTTHPITVIKAITGSPKDKLKLFSDAFKLRDR
jgi:biotin operon repressor